MKPKLIGRSLPFMAERLKLLSKGEACPFHIISSLLIPSALRSSRLSISRSPSITDKLLLSLSPSFSDQPPLFLRVVPRPPYRERSIHIPYHSVLLELLPQA